jgi:hypothetical protein
VGVRQTGHPLYGRHSNSFPGWYGLAARMGGPMYSPMLRRVVCQPQWPAANARADVRSPRLSRFRNALVAKAGGVGGHGGKEVTGVHHSRAARAQGAWSRESLLVCRTVPGRERHAGNKLCLTVVESC